jgi:hypothetical protein
MPKYHDDNVNLSGALTAMSASLDMKAQRLQLCLIDSTRYWVHAVLEEWRDAVLIRQDNDRMILLMKHTLQSIEPVPRPAQPKAHADE